MATSNIAARSPNHAVFAKAVRSSSFEVSWREAGVSLSSEFIGERII
jgi:hypothetical protein